MTWASIPISHLQRRIQWLDERGGLLLDVVWPESSPFQECSNDLANLLRFDIQDDLNALKPMYHHYGSTDDRVRLLIEKARMMVMDMSSQTWWRFRHFRGMPFIIVKVVHPCDA